MSREQKSRVCFEREGQEFYSKHTPREKERREALIRIFVRQIGVSLKKKKRKKMGDFN